MESERPPNHSLKDDRSIQKPQRKKKICSCPPRKIKTSAFKEHTEQNRVRPTNTIHPKMHLQKDPEN